MVKEVKRFKSDVDLDFANREDIIKHLDVVPAGIIREDRTGLVKHNTGVYATKIPVDPFVGCASLDHREAEDRGYVKLDFLNVTLYQRVRDEMHLVELMNTAPDWAKLRDRAFFERLIHVGAHYDTMLKMPEPVDSIPRMAMFLAVIRPAKRHLIGKPWAEVAKTVWDPDPNGGYAFKKSHSIAYSHLVVVHMNLDLADQGN